MLHIDYIEMYVSRISYEYICRKILDPCYAWYSVKYFCMMCVKNGKKIVANN